MEYVLYNKDLTNRIKSFLYYTERQLLKFKSYHYFFYQSKLNTAIQWVGYVLNKGISLEECYMERMRTIYIKIIL